MQHNDGIVTWSTYKKKVGFVLATENLTIFWYAPVAEQNLV